MSKIEELILKIDTTKRNPTKKDLWDLIEQTLKLLGKINEDYKKIYEGSEDNPAILESIEDKYKKIKKEYDNLFLADEQGIIKSEQLQKQIDEIKIYHKELLEGINDNDSIKDDIEDSQEKITKFYNFLFSTEDNDKESKKDKIKKCITEIEQFYEKLMNADNGFKIQIEDIYQKISKEYDDLFVKKNGTLSKVQKLKKQISDIEKFNYKLEDTKSSLDGNKNYLKGIKKDMETTRKDIKSLLSSATLKTLTQGYQESKEEYSIKGLRKSESNSKKTRRLSVFLYNVFYRHFVNLLNYIIFYLPLGCYPNSFYSAGLVYDKKF